MSVSIVVTSHNYARYLGAAVDSCLRQRGLDEPPEIIVVDDASTDGTQRILAELQRIPNLRTIALESNGGSAAAANTGFLAATRRYVVRVDADDYVLPDLARMLAGALDANPHAFAAACDYDVVDAHGGVVVARSAREHPIACGVMYRRAQLLGGAMYDASLRDGEEAELRARLGDRYTVCHVGVSLYSYRFHRANKTLTLPVAAAAA